MRTTLDIDGRLLQEAMMRAKVKTKTEAVERGLQELINAERRRALMTAKGKGYGLTVRAFLEARGDE